MTCLGSHTHVAEEALVGSPEGAPQQTALLLRQPCILYPIPCHLCIPQQQALCAQFVEEDNSTDNDDLYSKAWVTLAGAVFDCRVHPSVGFHLLASSTRAAASWAFPLPVLLYALRLHHLPVHLLCKV